MLEELYGFNHELVGKGLYLTAEAMRRQKKEAEGISFVERAFQVSETRFVSLFLFFFFFSFSCPGLVHSVCLFSSSFSSVVFFRSDAKGLRHAALRRLMVRRRLPRARCSTIAWRKKSSRAPRSTRAAPTPWCAPRCDFLARDRRRCPALTREMCGSQGVLYEILDRLPMSEKAYERSAAVFEKALGAGHPVGGVVFVLGFPTMRGADVGNGGTRRRVKQKSV